MNRSTTSGPDVSVIIPSYESHATVRATLESLRRQTVGNFETILIDSGFTDAVARIAADFPEVRYHRSERQMLPHDARNFGSGIARSDILVFTDPDIVAAPDWLENLLSTYRQKDAAPVSGAVASLRKNWLETGIHLAKFDLWLPGGKDRTVPVAASVNFLCGRELLKHAGGFDGSEMIGDSVLSWDLVRLGHQLHFAADAVVYHDHRSTFGQLLRERFIRGADFARLRSGREDWSAPQTISILAVSILPVRLVKLMVRSLNACIRAGCTLDWITAFPVLATGHTAWLAGEISQYWKRLQVGRAAREAKQACT